MNLTQLRESKCDSFIYRETNHASGRYETPILKTKTDVFEDVGRTALMASLKYDSTEDSNRDMAVLRAVDNCLAQYTEYLFTKEMGERLTQLTGFKPDDWSNLFKA